MRSCGVYDYNLSPRVLSVFVICFAVSSAFRNVELSDVQPGYVHSLSADGPTTALINREQSSRDAVRRFCDAFSGFEEDVKLHSNGSAPPNQTHNIQRQCYNNPIRPHTIRRYGWHAMENPCVYHISQHAVIAGKRKDASDPPQSLLRSVHAFHEVQLAVSQEIRKRKVNQISFRQPISMRNLSTESLTCHVFEVTGFRIVNQWFIRSSFISAAMPGIIPQGERYYLNEFSGASSGDKLLQSASMHIPFIHSDQSESMTHNATTSVVKWSRSSELRNSASIKQQAFRQAQSISDVDVQRAKDALYIPDLVILVLPMFMNLVPVAALAKNPFAMAIAVLFSDVWSVLPIIIKGVELVGLSEMSYISASIRMGDVFSTPNNTVAAFIGVADCRMTDVTGMYGWLFIAIGVFMLLVGLVIEVVALYFRYKAIQDLPSCLDDGMEESDVDLEEDTSRKRRIRDWDVV